MKRGESPPGNSQFFHGYTNTHLDPYLSVKTPVKFTGKIHGLSLYEIYGNLVCGRSLFIIGRLKIIGY
jgi:hypothetical protein